MLQKKLTLPNVSTLTAVHTLKRVPMRIERMKSQLNGWYSPVYYLDNLDYRTISDQCHQSCTTTPFCKLGARNKAQRSMYAIYYANVVLSRAALAVGIQRLLVIEDDVIFAPSLMREQMASIDRSLTRSWKYVAIGCSQYKPAVGVSRRGMSPCSRAYLLSPGGMRRISFGVPFSCPIDYAMLDMFRGCDSDVYTLTTTPIKHGSFIYRRHRGVDF